MGENNENEREKETGKERVRFDRFLCKVQSCRSIHKMLASRFFFFFFQLVKGAMKTLFCFFLTGSDLDPSISRGVLLLA